MFFFFFAIGLGVKDRECKKCVLLIAYVVWFFSFFGYVLCFCTCTVPYYWDCLRLLLFFFFRPSSLSFSESYLFFFRLCFFLFPTQVNPKFVPCSYYPISGFFSLCAKKETKEKKRQREMKKKQQQRRREETLGHNPQPRKSNGSVMRGRRWKHPGNQSGNQSGQRERRKCGPDDGVGGVWVYTQFRVCSLSLSFFFFCVPVFIV